MKKINNWLLLFFGLILVAFGVGFIVRADLGVLPTTCLPYVISNITGITIGKATIIFQSVLIVGQILVLRKKYKMEQLLQIPVGFCFGYIMDFALFVLSGLEPSSYFTRWIIFLIGVLISAIGVSFEVIAGVATLATEGFVIAVTQIFPIRFGTMKIVFDTFLVSISLLFSLIFLHYAARIREGTLVSAILLGFFSRYIMNIYQKNQE